MNLEKFIPSPRREVAKWLLMPSATKYKTHFGVHLYSDGSVVFYDLFSHRAFHDDEHVKVWDLRFWLRETFDDIFVGEDAELACRYSRRIKLDRRTTRWLLRADRMPLFSLEDSQETDVLSWMLNIRLEEIFWAEIAEYLVCQPLKREPFDAPDEPFPTRPAEIIVNVPVYPPNRGQPPLLP